MATRRIIRACSRSVHHRATTPTHILGHSSSLLCMAPSLPACRPTNGSRAYHFAGENNNDNNDGSSSSSIAAAAGRAFTKSRTRTKKHHGDDTNTNTADEQTAAAAALYSSSSFPSIPSSSSSPSQPSQPSQPSAQRSSSSRFTPSLAAQIAASTPRDFVRRNILGMERSEIEAEVIKLGIAKFHTNTIFNWLYRKGARDFESMTGLAKDARDALSRRFVIGYPDVGDHQKSSDGTQKWLAALRPGQSVETVFIPSEYENDEESQHSRDRGAICVSSQVGCTLTCAFCHTGTMDKKNLRNLTTEEIIGQLMLAKTGLNDWMGNITAKNGNTLKITNVVMMGMGEPLYNYRNVLRALKLMNDPLGLGISKRKLTLSTSGVVPNIYKLAEDLSVSLAISLHAVNDELRDRIVPINKQFPLAELMKACRAYPGVKPSRKMTFEYVMLKGVNDSDADARELVRLLKDIPSLVNLIPFNPWAGAPFESSSNNTIHRFATIVEKAGQDMGLRVAPTPREQVLHTPTNEIRTRRLYVPDLPVPQDLPPPNTSSAPLLSAADSRSVFLKCTIRWPRGRDIMAACGQLAVKQLRDTLPSPTPTVAATTAAPSIATPIMNTTPAATTATATL